MRLLGILTLILTALVSTGCFVTDAELAAALDRDGDGYLPVQTGGDDCDEGRADVNPGMPEICGDGLDNNCDGFPDDDGVGARQWFVDADGDGYGIESTVSACTEPEGYAPEAGDCDDDNSGINPGVDDLCDGIDQDCDGVPDDEVPLVERYRDGDGDGIGTADEVVLACTDVPGFVSLAGDCDDTDPTISPVATDLCDGVDQDCDGVVDDDAVFTIVFRDADGDGIGTALDTLTACGAIAGYVLLGGDCDDTDPTISPAAVDLCDGIDQDCDGIADDDALLTLYFQDNDGDGAGNPDVAVETCGSVPGFVFASGDCDDTDPGISPFILDGCDGLDQDCDGAIDEDAVRTLYFEDLDGDGIGTSISVEDCTLPAGYALVTGDCDDSDGSIRPGVNDFCDGLDQDCDGAIDEDASFRTWFRDLDGDGLGRTNGPRSTCDGAPSGYVATPGDCNDNDAGITIPAWYPDLDGDGVGEGTPTFACNTPADHSAVDGDCDDLDPDRYPDNLEICNSWVDEDCDDSTDCRWPLSQSFANADAVVPLPPGVLSIAQAPDLVGGPEPDLFVTYSDRLEIVSGGNSPTIGAPSASIPPCFGRETGDLDGDGREDLLCDLGLAASVYLGGGGFLLPAMELDVPGTMFVPTSSSPLGAGVWFRAAGILQFIPFSMGTSDLSDVAATIDIDGSAQPLSSCGGSAFECLVVTDLFGLWAFRNIGAGAHGASDAFWNVFPVAMGASVLSSPFLDLTGDGVDDLVAVVFDSQSVPPGASIQVAPGPLLPSSNLAPVFVALTNLPAQYGDIDGDGHTDGLAIQASSSFSAYHVYYGGPNGLGPSSDGVVFESNLDQVGRRLVDWDADGRTDFLIIDNDQQALLVIYGTGI